MQAVSSASSPQPRRVRLDEYLQAHNRALHEFRRLFRRGAKLVIFDIGCCEGEDAILFARHFHAARVLAFEPLPDNQTICRANFAWYQADRVELVPVALSDRQATAEFYVSSGEPPHDAGRTDHNYGNKSSSLLPPAGEGPMHGWLRFERKIDVPCTTFDRFCEERGIARVDLVHLDVQGAESLVLAGATRSLPRVAGIFLEVSTREFYRGQTLKDALAETLRGAGFMLVRDFPRPEGEGDQFWVNRRLARSWVRLMTARLRDAVYGICGRRSR